jgi:hypothetical protein
MKTIASISSVIVALAVAALPAKAATYAGTGNANGGLTDGTGINSVVINNDASTITFTINSTQPMASWIFYGIELQYVGGGGSGDTSLINPWGPHVGISTGVNALVNTWGTGASALTYSGGTWTQNASGNYVAGGTGSTSATMTFSLASLGLSVGSSFNFDVVSSYTGGTPGQSAYGALDISGWAAESDNSYQPWLGSNFYDSATASGSTFSSTIYTVEPVPEPTTFALLGLGALFGIGRTFRKR